MSAWCRHGVRISVGFICEACQQERNVKRKPTYEQLESEKEQLLAEIAARSEYWFNEVKHLQDEKAQLESKNKELERQVAMLMDAAKNFLNDSYVNRYNKDRSKKLSCGHGEPCACSKNALQKSIESSQATADTFIRKVEARALEEAADAAYTWHDDQYAELKLRAMAEDKLKG